MIFNENPYVFNTFPVVSLNYCHRPQAALITAPAITQIHAREGKSSWIGPMRTQIGLVGTTDTCRDLKTVRIRCNIHKVSLESVLAHCRIAEAPRGDFPHIFSGFSPDFLRIFSGFFPDFFRIFSDPLFLRGPHPRAYPWTPAHQCGGPHPHTTHTHKPNCHPGDGDAKLCGGGSPHRTGTNEDSSG